MKIRTNLTQHQLHTGLPEDVTLDILGRTSSRTHAATYTVYLRGYGARHTRRPNPGSRGQQAVQYGTDARAATYDDWGVWLAHLFNLDPTMVANQYRGREDFHAQTKGAYLGVAA